METKIQVLDHGFVELRNCAGPIRRPDCEWDADDTDPANSARFSFDAADDPDRTREADLKLARYLLKNKHTTPFEMIEIWLTMQMPIFVARHFVRHRTVSINEVSARYVQLPNQFYIPDPRLVGQKAGKQGRTIETVDIENVRPSVIDYIDALKETCQVGYDRYETALEDEIPNELARCFLPLNVYTKWLWKQDLHNMMHFLRLRMHDHTQYESRVYADAIYKMLCAVLPETMKIFTEQLGEGYSF